jgi:hypothetical protein
MKAAGQKNVRPKNGFFYDESLGIIALFVPATCVNRVVSATG